MFMGAAGAPPPLPPGASIQRFDNPNRSLVRSLKNPNKVFEMVNLVQIQDHPGSPAYTRVTYKEIDYGSFFGDLFPVTKTVILPGNVDRNQLFLYFQSRT